MQPLSSTQPARAALGMPQRRRGSLSVSSRALRGEVPPDRPARFERDGARRITAHTPEGQESRRQQPPDAVRAARGVSTAQGAGELLLDHAPRLTRGVGVRGGSLERLGRQPFAHAQGLRHLHAQYMGPVPREAVLPREGRRREEPAAGRVDQHVVNAPRSARSPREEGAGIADVSPPSDAQRVRAGQLVQGGVEVTQDEARHVATLRVPHHRVTNQETGGSDGSRRAAGVTIDVSAEERGSAVRLPEDVLHSGIGSVDGGSATMSDKRSDKAGAILPDNAGVPPGPRGEDVPQDLFRAIQPGLLDERNVPISPFKQTPVGVQAGDVDGEDPRRGARHLRFTNSDPRVREQPFPVGHPGGRQPKPEASQGRGNQEGAPHERPPRATRAITAPSRAAPGGLKPSSAHSAELRKALDARGGQGNPLPGLGDHSIRDRGLKRAPLRADATADCRGPPVAPRCADAQATGQCPKGALGRKDEPRVQAPHSSAGHKDTGEQTTVAAGADLRLAAGRVRKAAGQHSLSGRRGAWRNQPLPRGVAGKAVQESVTLLGRQPPGDQPISGDREQQ